MGFPVTETAMNGSRRGEVITFYSFKGGVGRSMALANVAAIYAQQGKSVLALDFDFEAPGLHRYFLTKEPRRYTPEGPQSGLLNLFDALRDRLRNVFPHGQNLEGAEAQSKMRAMVAELLDSGAYKYRVRFKNPNTKNAPPAEVDFIAAARFDATHPELLRAFDWQDFYDDYAELFPAIVAELKSRYDVVLVDSRTGMTDIGSICTMVLPDKLVLAFTPNEQSLAGALDAGWQAIQGRKEAPEPRELSIFPLVSRVEEGEEEQKRKWIADARGRFGRLFSRAYERPEVDLETYFNVVRIPHKSFYAYGERIAAEEQAVIELGAMAQAFHQLAAALEYPDAMQAQDALA
jgi:cellulose biosynthesis protein BcsQ